MAATYSSRKPLILRFSRSVNIPTDASECWLWTGYTSIQGYGKLTIGPRVFSAHRLSWMLHNGPLIDDVCVLHRCDVRACVNPRHLFLGDRLDNALDMKAKDRHHTPPRKTHCSNGHPYTDENSRFNKPINERRWRRSCRTCHRLRERDRHRRKAALKRLHP